MFKILVGFFRTQHFSRYGLLIQTSCRAYLFVQVGLLYSLKTAKTKNKSKPNQNILYGNKLNNQLEEIFGDILLIKKMDETLKDCNLIFDSNYLTNKEIINCVDKLKNRNKINFWFLSSDYSYIIRASGMNQKGNAIFL